MSIKNSTTACSGIDWNSLLGLLQRLKKDGKHREYLLIGTGCYLGLRASDLLNLKWEDVIDKKELTLFEVKTGKKRKLIINDNLSLIFKSVYSQLITKNESLLGKYIFMNRNGNKLSIQYVNRILHDVFRDYNIKVQNGSTHTLRKTFGKRVWEMDGKSERSLIYLSQIFNHSNSQVTRRYIGIIQEDINQIYLDL